MLLNYTFNFKCPPKFCLRSDLFPEKSGKKSRKKSGKIGKKVGKKVRTQAKLRRTFKIKSVI